MNIEMKKYMTAALVVFTLAAAGTLMNSTRTVAQAGGPTVTIDQAQLLPLPVSGSATVSGTVAATQSGPWNVGIVGTPTFGLRPRFDRGNQRHPDGQHRPRA